MSDGSLLFLGERGAMSGLGKISKRNSSAELSKHMRRKAITELCDGKKVISLIGRALAALEDKRL